MARCHGSWLSALDESFCWGSPCPPSRRSCSRSQPCLHRSERKNILTPYTCKIVYEKPHSNKPKQVTDKCIAHTHQTNPPTVSSIAAEKGVAFHDSPLGSKSFQYFIQLQIEDFAQRIQPVLRHINVLRFLESKAFHVL